MNTYTFSNFPKAIVAFGNNFQSSDFQKLQKNLVILKKIAMGTSQVLGAGQTYVACLKNPAQWASKVSLVVNVLVMLVGEVDQLYEELKKLEQRIFDTIFEGKLKALTLNLKNLEHAKTSEMQKVAEIVSAIAQMNELLPLFANEDSIFRKQFYQGAPLFIRLCIILKQICLIAEETDGYNTENLQGLKQDYQNVLDCYRIKCIGSRMASCYVKKMRVFFPDNIWTNDWDRHYELYKKYYEYTWVMHPLNPFNSSFIQWIKYAEDLGGKGWWLHGCGQIECKIIDTWDTRSHEEVQFEPFEINTTEIDKLDLHTPFGVLILVNKREYYRREVLAEYRKRVEEVMLEFFNDASVIT